MLATTNRPHPTPTLLDLVMELAAAGATEGEVVAAVQDLLETGRIRLIGHLRESDARTPLCPASHPPRFEKLTGSRPNEEACLT